jgi:hypothetical protein
MLPSPATVSLLQELKRPIARIIPAKLKRIVFVFIGVYFD